VADAGAPEPLAEPFPLLGGVLFDEHSLEELLAHVLRVLAQTMPSVSAGSISLVRGGAVFTSNSTSADARQADDAQYRSGLGPCLAAIVTGEQLRVEIDTARERWPEYASAAIEAGFHTSLSTPLRVRDETLGALNLYGHAPDGFQGAEQRLAELFAEQASIALRNALAYMSVNETAANLKEALASREAIGIATGLLMG